MGKNAKAAAQRAKKKQQKDKKRQQKSQVEKQRRQLAGPGPSLGLSGRGANPYGLASHRPPDWKPATEGIRGLARKRGVHPHAAAWMVVEEADEIELPDALWTLEKIGALGTPAILTGLEERGVGADEAAFVERAGSLGSAWKLAEELWAPALQASASVHDRDFLGLAAYALWKHWCSDVPSREKVIDLLKEGLAADNANDRVVAAERWLEAWDSMKPLLPPEVRTFEAAEDLFELGESLLDWVDNLTMAADSAARTDAGIALRASRVIDEVLAQFASESDYQRHGLLGDRGSLLFRAGRPEDGERVFRELIAATPDLAMGYVRLAEAWEASGVDQERSLALLEEAALRVEDGEDWDLEERIEELRAELANPTA